MFFAAWLPKESFGVKVQIKRSDVDRVTGCLVLIDTLAGQYILPLSYVKIGRMKEVAVQRKT